MKYLEMAFEEFLRHEEEKRPLSERYLAAEARAIERIIKLSPLSSSRIAGSIPVKALYRPGGHSDVQMFWSSQRRGVCITGENVWARERFDRIPAVDLPLSESDIWVCTSKTDGERKFDMTIVRSTYAITTEQGFTCWTASYENITAAEAVGDGLRSVALAKRCVELIGRVIDRDGQDSVTTSLKTSIERLEAILTLLRVTLIIAVTFTAFACSGDGGGTQPDGAPPIDAPLPPDAPLPGGGKPGERCTLNAQCESNTCIPGRVCAATEDVAYISSGGDGYECTITKPCILMTMAPHILARPIWRVLDRVEGSIRMDGFLTQKEVTVVGEPGFSALTRADGQHALVQAGNRGVNVTLAGMLVDGPPTAACVEALNGGMVTLYDSTVIHCSVGVSVSDGTARIFHGSEIANVQDAGVRADGGRIAIDRATIVGAKRYALFFASTIADVRNSLIVFNGRDPLFQPNNSTVTIVDGDTWIQNNTIAFNRFTPEAGPPTLGAALSCLGEPAVSASGNIIALNKAMRSNQDTPQSWRQTFRCVSQYSMISLYPGESQTPTNFYVLADSFFHDVWVDYGVDFRLLPANAAVDGADPDSTVGHDIDGYPRTGLRDIGAYELRQ